MINDLVYHLAYYWHPLGLSIPATTIITVPLCFLLKSKLFSLLANIAKSLQYKFCTVFVQLIKLRLTHIKGNGPQNSEIPNVGIELEKYQVSKNNWLWRAVPPD